jgi:hypothetical protein
LKEPQAASSKSDFPCSLLAFSARSVVPLYI